MKKIILKIFLCLYIFSIVYSECILTEDKKKCKGDNSGKYPEICCLFKKISPDPVEDSQLSNDNCKTIPYSSYYEGYKKEYKDNILYEVTCNSSLETFTLERCGNTYKGNPSKKECKKYSTYVDSCCYYSGENKKDDPTIEGTKFEKGCYWLGSKYEGSIFWAGARLECSSQFLKYSLFVILYLIISL